jgi:hypothetical protein
MNNFPRMKLQELLGAYGSSLYQNPQYCGQLLRDACRDYPAEVEVLLDALDMHVADDLVRANSSTYPMVLPALVQRLQVERGMPEERARWAVDSWAGALGISSSIAQLPSNSTSATHLSVMPPPPPPPPSTTNNIYDASTYNSRPSYDALTYNSKPFYPPETPRIQVQPQPPKSGWGRTFLLMGILCIVLVGSVSGYIAFADGGFLHGGPVNASSTATVTVPATATATPVPYPMLSQAYSGRARNTTANLNAVVSLTAISQNKSNISGEMTVGLPLAGSGPFQGTITSAGVVNFTVNSNDGSQGTIKFTGTLGKNGTMQGTYSVSNGQGGTLEASPATNPVVYPLLFANYTGTYRITTTGQSGVLSLNISAQNQETFKGTCTSTGVGTVATTGSVDDKNDIQFSITQPNGVVVKFVGNVNANRSLSGTYTASSGYIGTWSMNPY